MNVKTLKFALMFIALQFFVLSSFAQTLNITGVVTEANTDEPMIGVTVICQRTGMGAITDIDGAYSVKAQKGDNLEFSFIGMKTQFVVVDAQKEINVVMAPDAIDVEAVMVVAYGTAKKSSFTGSAEVVGKKQLENRTVSNITKALDGNIAGLETTSGGGQPGSASTIVIRGVGSINASSTPLYVVDGVPYDGSMNSLDPGNIETITVLKDASASALYGSRAANGVIVVTTKSGKSGKSVINFKGSVGVAARTQPEYERLNQSQYMEAAYEYTRNNLMINTNGEGLSLEDATQVALTEYMNNLGGERYNPFNIKSSELIDPITGKIVDGAVSRWNDDWMREAMRKVAIRQEYQVSANGGNENTRYYASIGYLNEQGVAKESGFDRFSAMVKVDSKVKPWVLASLKSNYSHTKTNMIQSGGNDVWTAGMMMGPIYPVYERDADGNMMYDKDGQKMFDFGATRPNQTNYNSIALLSQDQNYGENDNVGLNARIEFGDKNNKNIGFLKDFKFAVSYGMEYNMNNSHQFYNPFTGNQITVGGRMRKTKDKTLSSTLNEILTYDKQFKGGHNLNVILGHEYYDRSMESMSASRTGFLFSDSDILDQGAKLDGASSSSATYRLTSYFANAQYNYSNKYFLQASFRVDGSSRFHSKSRWGNFWAIGGSWCMTEEKFMKGSRRWLDNLTVKASYGVVGNNDINTYYAWQNTYDYGWSNGNLPGVMVGQTLGNENLRWESRKDFNVGIDTRMFEGRFGVILEYYYKQNDDMLLSRPLPLSSGVTSVNENVGNMVNQGVELTLSGTPVIAGDFRWQSTLMVTANRNKVVSLADGQDIMMFGNKAVKVGAPFLSYFIYESAGVDPETGDQLYYTSPQFVDQKGATTTGAEFSERKLMGSRTPLFRGSFSNVFSYKGFEFSFLLNYSVGGKIFDGNYVSLMGMDAYGQSWHKDMERRWRKPGDVTDVPRLEKSSSLMATSRYLVSASYLKIQNVSLAYTFSFKNMKKTGISALRLHLSGDNLYTIAARKGLDPQYNLTGDTSTGYVPVSTVSFGVDLTF